MCVYSVIGDHYRGEGWTVPAIIPQVIPNPPSATPPLIPWKEAAPATLPWDKEKFDLLQEILKKVQELDQKLGMPQCEDPEKVDWIKSLEARIAKLEQDHGKRGKRNKRVSRKKSISQ